MNVLHLLASGGPGGIESLMRDYSDYSKHNNIFVFFWKGGSNCDRMKAAGHMVIVLDYSDEKFFKTYLRLLTIYQDNNIDAVVTHHAAPVFWVYLALLKNKFKDLNTYIYAHGNIDDMFRHEKKGVFIRKAIFGIAIKKSNAVIAISNSVKNSIVAKGFDVNKIRVVYNGVDYKKYDIDDRRDDKLVSIIFVGRLIRQKGVQLLIQALKMLDGEYSFRCDIVGDGPMRTELEELAEKYNMTNEVRFHGIRNDIPKMLVNAHVFVHPAIWEEGFGISVVEAMAAGTVPIAFRKGAIPEIIDDRENGFIVDECSAKSLSLAIANVIKLVPTERFKQIQINAKAKAASFKLSKYVDALDKAIGEI